MMLKKYGFCLLLILLLAMPLSALEDDDYDKGSGSSEGDKSSGEDGSSAQDDDDENPPPAPGPEPAPAPQPKDDYDYKKEPCECPKESDANNGQCYRFKKGKVSPDQAKTEAEERQTELAGCEDESDDYFLRGMACEAYPDLPTDSFYRITLGYRFERDAAGNIISCKKPDGSPWTSGYGCPCDPNFGGPGTGPWSDGKCTAGEPEPKKKEFAKCVQLIGNSKCGWQWAATPCDSSAAADYICRFKSGRKIRKQNAKCDKPGYVQRKGKCYKISKTTEVTYEQADTECQNEGGNLTSIRSKSHLIFLRGIVVREYPLAKKGGEFLRIFHGLQCTRSGDKLETCKWKDGTPSKFGNPKNFKGFFKADFPYCNKDGILDGVDEPKEGNSATKGFFVKNYVKSGCFALGPRTATWDFKGAYICAQKASCADGSESGEGYCKPPSTTTTEAPTPAP